MLRKAIWIAAGLAALALGGCGADVRMDAAESVEHFLRAAHEGDNAGFEAAIDRPAVRQDLRRQLIAMAQSDTLEVEGGPSDFALDRMISPDAFHMVQSQGGEALPNTPNAAEIAFLMKVVDKRHVCLRDIDQDDRCLLTFEKKPKKEGWKLVGMQATDLRIRVQPQPDTTK